MWAPTAPRITFAPPGESSIVATSPGVATVTALLALVVALVSSSIASSTVLQLSSVCLRRTWIAVPVQPPSTVVRSRFRQTPRPASLSPIFARIPASVSVTNQPWSCSTIWITVADSGCQSQFCASRPPAPTTEHSVGPWPARISVRALTAISAWASTFAPLAIASSSSCAVGGIGSSAGTVTPVSSNIRSYSASVLAIGSACARPNASPRSRGFRSVERWTGNVIALRRLPHLREVRTRSSRFLTFVRSACRAVSPCSRGR